GLHGKPDLVFGPCRKVIFVHGCFWHGHDDQACRDGRMPHSNQSYWRPKLARNRERDAVNIAALKASGWDVLVIWECETGDGVALKARVTGFLGPRVDARKESSSARAEK
ncbi:MAG: very short patch repair endonuclease, partial [Methylocella sp.]